MVNQIGHVVGIIFMIAASIFFTSCDNAPPQADKPIQKISIAVMPHSFTGYTIFVSQEKGFFKEQGLAVTLQTKFPHGKGILQAMIEKKTELAVSSETPFMHAVLSGAEIATITATVKARKHLGIVCRKDKGISSAGDLRGKKIGVTIGSNGEFFLDTVLLLNGIQRNAVEVIHLKPNQMIDSILKGDVDAVATWNPQLSMARKELGEQGRTFYADNLYSPFFIVSARQDYVLSYPDTITKVVRALHNTTEFIHKNQDESQKIISKYLKIDPLLLKELSATYSFKTNLEQSFLITLENQSKWAIKKNRIPQTDIPNFLNYIYTDALEEVVPEAMTIIR